MGDGKIINMRREDNYHCDDHYYGRGLFMVSRIHHGRLLW